MSSGPQPGGASGNETGFEPGAEAIPGWRLLAPTGRYRFQQALPVERWQARPVEKAGTGAADDSMYFVDLTSVTQAILHEREFGVWHEAARWRQMYPHSGYAAVEAVIATDGWQAVAQRLPVGVRPVLQPATMTGGARAVDPGMGRALPERLAVPLLRRLVELAVFLLDKTRGFGPAPSAEAWLADLYFLPDPTTPRLKWVSAYLGLPSAPDQQGRRPAGAALALVATAVLTGRYDAEAARTNAGTIRPGLTTQLPAWIEALRGYDGAAAPAGLLAQFDAAIADINTHVVGDLYRPLDG